MRGPVTKVCEVCNHTFECGQYGCWCAQVKITEPQMTWIEQSFHDCLCPGCLQQVAEGKLGPSSIAKPQ
jgi:hypothetical protein